MNAAGPEPASASRLQARPTNTSPHSTGTRGIWELAIGVVGLIYLGLVLFVNLYSPVFGFVLIVLAGHEIMEPRCGKRGR